MIDTQSHTWFAWLIVFCEMAVGLGLIFGCLTAIPAFFGTLLNFSFMMAGSTSSNPMMFGLTIFLILTWKNAGWWGLDRFVLALSVRPGTKATCSNARTPARTAPRLLPSR